MDRVVPWARLCALIEPHYPKVGAKCGRPPKQLEMMLRIVVRVDNISGEPRLSGEAILSAPIGALAQAKK